jgi:hypothetical protein
MIKIKDDKNGDNDNANAKKSEGNSKNLAFLSDTTTRTLLPRG